MLVRRAARHLVLPSLLLAALAPPAARGAGTFNPELRLTSIPGQSWGPRLAAHHGVLHAVWFEYPAPSFSDPEVFYSRSFDDGRTWNAPKDLSNAPARPDVYPFVAADAFGVYVVWSSSQASGDLFFARSTNDGYTFTAAQQLTPTDGLYSRSSDILVDSQGTLHLVWYDFRTGVSQVLHQASCDHGATFRPLESLTQFDGMVDNEQPRLAQTGSDLFVLFRSTRAGDPQGGYPPNDVYMIRAPLGPCAAATGWLHPAQLVSRALPDERSNDLNAGLAGGRSGTLHVAYWDQRTGNNVTYRRGAPRGRGFGPPFTLSAFPLTHNEAEGVNQDFPGLVEDSGGGVHALFAEHATVFSSSIALGRLYYRSSDDNGATWNALAQLGTTVTAASPTAVWSMGRVHVAWIDNRDGNAGTEIYYRNEDLTLQAVTQLVTHYYQAILGRAPDAGGQAYWEGQAYRMLRQAVDVKEAFMVMAGSFFDGPEYAGRNRTNAQFVTDLYQTFFNRAPDPGGLAFWTNEIATGSSRDMVMYFFLFSPEFSSYMTGLFGDTAARSETYAVGDFYRGALGRLPDDGGLAFWSGRFRAAQCAGASAVSAEVESISSQFFSGAEYAARSRTNAQYVQDLYYTFLRRYASASEVAFWVSQLDGAARTRDQERRDFIAAPEFQARVTAIAGQGCWN